MQYTLLTDHFLILIVDSVYDSLLRSLLFRVGSHFSWWDIVVFESSIGEAWEGSAPVTLWSYCDMLMPKESVREVREEQDEKEEKEQHIRKHKELRIHGYERCGMSGTERERIRGIRREREREGEEWKESKNQAK
ncbi:hypothetical protein GG344DRAFT_70506 [Lentinula edodes]|nr:hypothetical protein GG344DRAFT_70506 [Lentinula edodes]